MRQWLWVPAIQKKTNPDWDHNLVMSQLIVLQQVAKLFNLLRRTKLKITLVDKWREYSYDGWIADPGSYP